MFAAEIKFGINKNSHIRYYLAFLILYRSRRSPQLRPDRDGEAYCAKTYNSNISLSSLLFESTYVAANE